MAPDPAPAAPAPDLSGCRSRRGRAHLDASGGPIRSGEPLAAYIPLAAWQDYEQLLAEHERQAGKYAAALQLTAAAAAAPGWSGQLDAMIAWVAALSPQAVRADASGLLFLLARHLKATLRAACPLPPEEIAPLFHRYFCLIQTLDERFRLLDARYAALWHAAAPVPEEQQEIARRWQESKTAVVQQILGGEPGEEGGT